MFCAEGIGTGAQIAGGHAEYMLAYADAAMLLPDALDYEQAAPLFCAGYTVWSGLRWAKPEPGERLAVVGIGGLGHLAVQYAKAAGFTTIAVSHSPDKDKLIRELGADEIVRDGKGLADAGGADVVLGTSNSADAMADSIAGLRPDGRLVLMGFENKRCRSIRVISSCAAYASSAANRTVANTFMKLCKSPRPEKSK
jgi:alcohol dehydrogenase